MFIPSNMTARSHSYAHHPPFLNPSLAPRLRLAYILPAPAHARDMPSPSHITLEDAASAIHARHLAGAEKALAATPPRLDLFWLHSRMCDTAVLALEELKELSSVLPKQPTEDAENPPQTEGRPST